jgi:hypothetical protein
MDRDRMGMLRAALTELIDEHKDTFRAMGISADVGRGSFTHSNGTFKVVFSEVAEGGTVLTPEAERFKLMASMDGMKAEDLGREVTLHDGKRYRIVGRNKGSKVLLERVVDGKSFVMNAPGVARILNRGGV